MKIQSRLFACFSVLIVMLVLLGGRAWWSAATQQRMFDQFRRESVESMAELDEVWVALLNSRRLEKDIIISSGFSQKVAAQRKLWEAEQAHMAQLIAHLADTDAKRREDALQVADSIVRYAEKARPTFDAAAAGTLNNASEAVEALMPATEAAGHAEERIEGWRHALREDGARRVEQAASRYLVDAGLTAAVVATAMIATVLMGLGLARSIVLPLRSATAFARDVGKGDLCTALTPKGHDEVADLGRGLLAMQDALRVLITQLHGLTSHIGTATAEIAAGNHDLAGRTERTAAKLQDTTSAMSELSATVTHAATLASNADAHAANASRLAQRGGAIVEQVVQTMTRMQQASKRIGDIIGVVDSIAFQTNILALNAAVEAARAGEQGRGFAVVAAEVRSLAQRSADAAKEIRGLISASVASVDEGSTLVHQAGAAMGDVVQTVQSVSEMIENISRASKGAANGIQEIGDSVVHIDSMTQQNAALVEQAAAAAESLRSQAMDIEHLIQRFHVHKQE